MNESRTNLLPVTDLNAGAGNAWASHNKLTTAPLATSNASDLADFGNLGDTRPAGSDGFFKKQRKQKVTPRLSRARHRLFVVRKRNGERRITCGSGEATPERRR